MKALLGQHQPVLLSESIHALNIKQDGIYIDATFGRGGHSRAILRCLSEKGRLFALDKDPEAIHAGKRDFGADPRFILRQDSFAHMVDWMQEITLVGKIDGILFDLGVSSPQFDDPKRGFSFLRDGHLDMRMNHTTGIDAATWLASVSEDTLATVLKTYGEERYAKRIAKAIISARKEHPITSTSQLAKIIADAHPRWGKHKHPATQSFQAIRIFINQELTELKQALDQSLALLKKGGRLAIISFHSLEDRLVKQFIRQHVHGNLPKALPIKNQDIPRALTSLPKMKPSLEEINNNPRARSAMLRVAEKHL